MSQNFMEPPLFHGFTDRATKLFDGYILEKQADQPRMEANRREFKAQTLEWSRFTRRQLYRIATFRAADLAKADAFAVAFGWVLLRLKHGNTNY